MHTHGPDCGCRNHNDDGDADAESAPVLAVNVGNTRVSFAPLMGGKTPTGAKSAPVDAIEEAARECAAALAGLGADAVAVIASVNDPAAERIERALAEVTGDDGVVRFGRDIEIPIRHTLDAAGEKTVGQDRLLTALAAYETAGQACVVIDAGTAITVDFVDGEGVFHGGAIAPGARMMLDALASRTASLPAVALEVPVALQDEAAPPFGKNTPDAMRTGVIAAARGLVRDLTDRYATFYGAYPQVIATGGDAALLFSGDELVEHIVPDLTLIGIGAAWREAIRAAASDEV